MIPMATHKYEEVSCNICHFTQDLKNRPDVQQGQGQQGQVGQGAGGGPNQGWGGQGPGGQGQPGGYYGQQQQQPAQYR